MSGLSSTVAALDEAARQRLAHSLVLALEGRSGPKAAPDTPPAANPVPETLEKTDARAAERAAREAPPETADGRKVRPGGGDLPVSAGQTAAAEPSAQSRVTAEYGPEGRLRVLRRDMTAERSEPEPRPGEASEAPQVFDPMGRMREISEFFRQDSRRYDPGFTRY